MGGVEDAGGSKPGEFFGRRATKRQRELSGAWCREFYHHRKQVGDLHMHFSWLLLGTFLEMTSSNHGNCLDVATDHRSLRVTVTARPLAAAEFFCGMNFSSKLAHTTLLGYRYH